MDQQTMEYNNVHSVPANLNEKGINTFFKLGEERRKRERQDFNLEGWNLGQMSCWLLFNSPGWGYTAALFSASRHPSFTCGHVTGLQA